MNNPSLSEDEFNVLNHLDLYKFVADISVLQEALGLKPHEVESILSKLEINGYIVKEDRDAVDWKITPSGESVVGQYRQFILNQVEQKAVVIELFEDFENLNVKFKTLVSRWQLKSMDDVLVLNDHMDPEYDAMILNGLFTLHKDVAGVLRRLAKFFPRYKRHIRRLDYAIEKLKSGEHDYIAKGHKSYHSVWYELHEDILKLWGRERIE